MDFLNVNISRDVTIFPLFGIRIHIFYMKKVPVHYIFMCVVSRVCQCACGELHTFKAAHMLN